MNHNEKAIRRAAYTAQRATDNAATLQHLIHKEKEAVGRYKAGLFTLDEAVEWVK